MYKVLVISSNKDKLRNLRYAFDGIYSSQCVLLTGNSLDKEVGAFSQDVIVVYLEGVKRQAIFPLIDFRAEAKIKKLPIILIADEDDTKTFQENVKPGADFTMERITGMEAIRKAVDRAAASTATQKHILVVDDDSVSLKVVKGYLDKNFKVTCVKSGQQAIKFLNKQIPDVVLLDCYMPEMDGPATLQQIRNMSKCSTLPVVFLTGNAERDMVMNGIPLHPSGFLLKPVKQEELIHKLEEIM